MQDRNEIPPAQVWLNHGRLAPGGQRLFQRNDGAADYYLADNSGSTPDNTDDGPLCIDKAQIEDPTRNRGRLFADARALWFTVPVIEEQTGRACRVGVSLAEAMALFARFGWQPCITPPTGALYAITEIRPEGSPLLPGPAAHPAATP